MCSRGFNYQKINDEITIGGFILREWGQLSQARKKALKNFPYWVISKHNLQRLLDSLSEKTQSINREIESKKQQVLEEWVEKEQYKTDFLKDVKEKIVEGLSFVHDYKQINAEIGQNINVIIETRYEAGTFDDKLEKASQQEKAIYWASKLLDEKLTVAKLLVNPDIICRRTEYKKFKFHGILIKYRRIYTSHIKNKNLTLDIKGNSYHEIIAHPLAVSVIPHTFLDNAIKYSLKDGYILIEVHDEKDYINFSVSSYGPRILRGEEKQIFYPFYRGEAARAQEEEGAGYGLYVSQLIAKEHLHSEIKVKQDPIQKPHFGHWTTFSIDIPLQAD
jgi:signal transduction histidine kinase